MRECTRCVMNETDPDITFKDGLCSHCQKYDKDEYVRRAEATKLQWIYHDLKKEKGEYQALIGLSGGVDSSLCLHHLKENDVRVLAFSIDNGWNTPAADENIMRLVEGLKVPFYRYTIDVDKFRKLQRAFVESRTLNIEIPTDHILMASTYEMAKQYGIKHIISGGNLATESIMPPAWGYNAKDLRFIRSVYKTHTGQRLSGLPTISLPQYLYNRFWKGIKIINLLDYYTYNREEAKKLLKDTYGWKDYGEKHEESKFTKLFQDVYLPMFGIDKRRAHYSSLINSKQMTRAEAVKLLEGKQLGDEVPRSHREYNNSEWIWNTLSQFYGYLSK